MMTDPLKQFCVCEEPDGKLYMYNEKSKELFQMIFQNGSYETRSGRTGWIFGLQDFWRSHAPRGAASTCTKVNAKKLPFYLIFAPHALTCRRNLWRDLKILVTLRTAVLQLPSKSYENRRKRSAFVQLSRNRLKGPRWLVFTLSGRHPCDEKCET